MSIIVSDDTFKMMTERIEEQSQYIKELEKANKYKDDIITELNIKYATKPKEDK